MCSSFLPRLARTVIFNRLYSDRLRQTDSRGIVAHEGGINLIQHALLHSRHHLWPRPLHKRCQQPPLTDHTQP